MRMEKRPIYGKTYTVFVNPFNYTLSFFSTYQVNVHHCPLPFTFVVLTSESREMVSFLLENYIIDNYLFSVGKTMPC